MRLAYVLLYLAVEIGVFVAMTMTLGFGWAVLITIAAAVVGFLLLRWQGAKVFGELRRASRNEVDARAPLADTAIMAGSTMLLVVPGVVSTLLGIVLLAPPTRRLVRPAVTAFGARRMVVAMDQMGMRATGRFPNSGFGRGTVIDGTVVDGDIHHDGDVAGSSPSMSGRQLPRGPRTP
ncbi:FxsA family protein [Gordonia sp. DT30]|uniref:FxsA family protein n=1 Tax=unclassified Gordonia (in: high G+C Gram-positive bacteria) TaxID=2657482 RepID=UPI003CF3901D